MKILLTGASSFTGYWFATKLISEGHDVTAIFTRENAGAYPPERLKRIGLLGKDVHAVYGCKFGDNTFIKLLKEEKFDVLCHHAAEVTNYKQADFDIVKAVAANTLNIHTVFVALKDTGCKLVITGSVFEDINKVDDSNQSQKHFSGYGLSKSISSDLFHYYARQFDVNIGKFIISNPFGAFEEKRFLNYLITGWLNNESRSVNTPDYVRDNIHVELLASYYAYFIEQVAVSKDPVMSLAPSGYIETQGDFAARVAYEMSTRLNKDCIVLNNEQKDFSEPLTLFNSDKIVEIESRFDAQKAWDELAAFYMAG
ncbi:epimerase [Pedobacter ginsengisoli]|uniref:Epimerase n=1 Tax=Pedobacter ginsengisoli TaxID=363852 RepID=A0A2D1U8N0_9SPHI|nr:NAD-dependent epimerase/dehydratase family protein [Pedobacter ginsengisoli]ATP57973.1 epimerase [Pedobacter ginsengisoli]